MKIALHPIDETGLLSAFARAGRRQLRSDDGRPYGEALLSRAKGRLSAGTLRALIELDALCKRYWGVRLRIQRTTEPKLDLAGKRKLFQGWATSGYARPGRAGYASRHMSPIWTPAADHNPFRVGVAVQLDLLGTFSGIKGKQWSPSGWLVRFRQVAESAGFTFPVLVDDLLHPDAGIMEHWGPLAGYITAIDTTLAQRPHGALTGRESAVDIIATLQGTGRQVKPMERYCQARLVLGGLYVGYADGDLGGGWRRLLRSLNIDTTDTDAIIASLNEAKVGVPQAAAI
jgi:hypothetical protein